MRITASITLEAGATVAPVMEALGKSFATPDAASATLGITVIDVISLESTNVGAPSPPLILLDTAVPLWALFPFSLLVVAVLVLLYRRHKQLARDRANLALSRDRANFDLQISVQVIHKLQRAFREAQGREGIDLVQREQAQADDTASLPSSVLSRGPASLSNGRGPASTLPPGPPSSADCQSVVEQEVVAPSTQPPPLPYATAMPAAPAAPAPGYNWALPWCAVPKKAQPKRPAQAGPAPASAPPAKKPSSNKPYHDFCREQRPLLPPNMSNGDREKLLGSRWKALSKAEKAKYSHKGDSTPPSSSAPGGGHVRPLSSTPCSSLAPTYTTAGVVPNQVPSAAGLVRSPVVASVAAPARMRTASSVLAVESRGVPHEALASSTDSETSSPDDCSGYSYHSTTPAASPSSSWQEHQEHINAELISLEQQVLAEALEGQLTGPEAIEVAIEEAMFQVGTSEANDETSTESGAIDETVHVREAIEDFLKDF